VTRRDASGTRPRSLLREPGRQRTFRREDAMAELDRTVWTAPVRNLVWVAARFGLG
jgi:hypothetical protein